MNDNVFAVAVGYNFGFIPADDLNGIHINLAGAIRFEGENWNLFKAANYEDSKKIDVLLDRYGEYSIKGYKIEPVIMRGSVEMTVPGYDIDRDSVVFGAYSFICEGKEIPIDFSGTSWNIHQDGDRILVSFETGLTGLLSDCFLDDCYEDAYHEAGLRINDITAEFLSKATSISEFMVSIELNGEELSPEQISQQGSYVIKSLSFENTRTEFFVNKDVIHEFNQTLDSNHKNSLSSMIQSANSKSGKSEQPLHDISKNETIR